MCGVKKAVSDDETDGTNVLETDSTTQRSLPSSRQKTQHDQAKMVIFPISQVAAHHAESLSKLNKSPSMRTNQQ